jgi:hypothetical protein
MHDAGRSQARAGGRQGADRLCALTRTAGLFFSFSARSDLEILVGRSDLLFFCLFDQSNPKSKAIGSGFTSDENLNLQ